ncbi:hypothetical protein CAPTEDRAFT_218546 [Capitella teleta]|uniref:Myb/SANT-like DNA-binding domain-containing protein n=1 Tax=Capitella teleta TaxID=283909 RepID=R7THM1_CAPTE|nr:hypothetical protein CAPTEDRAFT_218546 [Capitella teleta]|eukprot:ELT93219.1 hypothetical protein CAPTEDRAFT_218546 [Capitella teleta]
MEAKKRRSCNWSADEELLLLKAVKGRLGIIDGKFSPSLTRVKKKQAWEEVSAFLARSPTKRALELELLQNEVEVLKLKKVRLQHLNSMAPLEKVKLELEIEMLKKSLAS